MKFPSPIKQLKQTTYCSYLKIKDRWLHLAIFVVVVNPLLTTGLMKYFSTHQNNENVRHVAKLYPNPESELAAKFAVENNWRSKHSFYILLTIFWGLLVSLGIVLLAQQLTQLKVDKLALERKIAQKTVTTSRQLPPSNYQDNLELEKLPAVNYEPYILLANMSHELRSPLNTILGFAQIMEQELPELSMTQTSHNNIAIINRSGGRLLSIINDVVDLAKIETNQLTLEHNNIDFHTWLDNIEQSFKFQANSQGGEFSLIRQSNLPRYICIDKRRLQQIVSNLINYCWRSMPADISLAVTSSDLVQKTTEIDSPNHNQKYNIGFEVKNANLSASTVESATLFDPLIQVQQEQSFGEGSSLNLPISRKLSKLMGGDITVKNTSVTGLGTTFSLKIQAESIVAGELETQPDLRRIVGLESNRVEYRILVVDDSKTNRKIMTQLLETVGFQVEEAVNGQEAIDVWFRWQPHLIWMDFRMPVMNGCEATERIRAYSHDIYTPILALSASTLEKEKSLFKAAGCDDFVGKPFSENIIFDKIAEHLGIRYVYESINSSSPSNFKLTADALKVMPDRWLSQVEQAAIALDQDSLTQLLQEISSEHQDLKNALQKQIYSFDFDRILNLIDNRENN